MIGLIWFALVTVNGIPQIATIPETTKFKTEAECQAFGEKMSPRLADWARGAARMDWADKVEVAFGCRKGGQAI